MGKKRKSGKTLSGLQNGALRGLQIGAGFRDFRDFKSGQGLRIRAEDMTTFHNLLVKRNRLSCKCFTEGSQEI